jgi:predicted Zn-dependent peptidase
MDAEVGRIMREGVPPLEFEKLKAQLETEYVADNGRVAGVANNLATAHMMLGGAAEVNRELDRYLALTPQDLQQAASTYFTPERRVVLHYLPLSQKPQP